MKNVSYYEKSKMPTYHPQWFKTGALVISPHGDYRGTVLGFCESYNGVGECGVVRTESGQIIVTNMTSDFKQGAYGNLHRIDA